MLCIAAYEKKYIHSLDSTIKISGVDTISGEICRLEVISVQVHI